MTEDEAKTKWCFAAVASHTDPRGGFREDDQPHTFRQFPCLASGCMAWRKDGSAKFRDARTGKLYDRDLTGNGEWQYGGYCGLAGAVSA